MDQLIPLLNGMGPWGVVIGAVLTLAIQWARQRATPTAPAEPSKTPVLDALFEFIRRRQEAKLKQVTQVESLPWAADVDDDTADRVMGAFRSE